VYVTSVDRENYIIYNSRLGTHEEKCTIPVQLHVKKIMRSVVGVNVKSELYYL